MTTRRKRPHSGAVMARLWTRLDARAARPGAAAAAARRAPTARGCGRAPARSPAGAARPTAAGAAAASRLTNAVKRVPGGAAGQQRRDQLARVRPPCRRSRRARGRSGSGRRAWRVEDGPRADVQGCSALSRPRSRSIGIDARAAAEVPAGPRAGRARAAARAGRPRRRPPSLPAATRAARWEEPTRRRASAGGCPARRSLVAPARARAAPTANATCSCRATRT